MVGIVSLPAKEYTPDIKVIYTANRVIRCEDKASPKKSEDLLLFTQQTCDLLSNHSGQITINYIYIYMCVYVYIYINPKPHLRAFGGLIPLLNHPRLRSLLFAHNHLPYPFIRDASPLLLVTQLRRDRGSPVHYQLLHFNTHHAARLKR